MQQSLNIGAIAGRKVVDLTRVLGGPYCTQILGDHGAEIIKVEPPRGDEVRDWGPPFKDGSASYFHGVNRNKRSIAIDLTDEQGREVLLDILSDADVLIENFKPGSMERWGLGYQEHLRTRFPRLIHTRISGFGADGPFGGFPGYDAIVQAMAGMFSINGEPESGPTRLGVAMVDMGTGLYSAIAILMALLERDQSDAGQFIDMTLYDCAISLMHPFISNYVLSGRVPALTGNAHPNICPYDKYKTRTTDVFMGVGNDRGFKKLCEELGKPDLATDSRFQSNANRLEHRHDLNHELASILKNVDGHELCQRLLEAGIPAGPVMDTQQMFEHPHTLHRQMNVEADGHRGAGIPIKFSRTPGEIKRRPPKFSEHAEEILTERGYSKEKIKALMEKGSVLTSRSDSKTT